MSEPSKTIFRRAKDRENPFTMIDRTIFEDIAISWKAKGLMGYLLSRPDDWIVRMSDLVKRSTDGIAAVRSAILELEQHGYVTRFRERDAGGRFVRYVFEVHEIPIPLEQRTQPEKRSPRKAPPQLENPIVDNPPVENPKVENRTLTNTDLTETDHTERGPASAGSTPSVDSPPVTEENPEPEPEKVTAKHPAIQAFREVARRYPAKAWYNIIADTVGDKEEDIARWKRIVMAWVGSGWNPCNVKGMLDYWGKTYLPGENGNGCRQQGQDSESGDGSEVLRRRTSQIVAAFERRSSQANARASP